VWLAVLGKIEETLLCESSGERSHRANTAKKTMFVRWLFCGVRAALFHAMSQSLQIEPMHTTFFL
jgi:hypothetical protein